MKRALGFLRYVFTLPADIVSLLMVLVIRALWGSSLNVERGCIVVTLRSTSWPMHSWYRGWAGTTFCHSIMIAPLTPDFREATMDHELVHVEQIEARMMTGMVFGIIIAAIGHPLVGLALWSLSSVLNYFAAGVVAVIRGKPFYEGNAFEQAAYDSTRRTGTRLMNVRRR
jgi:hypothetical protein